MYNCLVGTSAFWLSNYLSVYSITHLTHVIHEYAILVREEFSCLEFIMNRDTINWILKKLNTGGRIWSIYQRKSIKTASATLW